MKHLFSMLMGVAIIFTISCNQGSQEAKSDTAVVPKSRSANLSKASEADISEALRKSRSAFRQHFADKKIPDTSALSAPLQVHFAQEYINAFSVVPLFVTSRAAGVDFSPSFAFNDTTLATFADLFNSGQIDGFRVYMAKYTGDELDFRNAKTNRITVILVGTKAKKDADGNTYYEDQFIPSSTDADLMVSIQDYTNPCTPVPCKGTLLANPAQ